MWRTGFPLKIVICGFKPRESLELDGSAGFFELGLSLLSVFLLGLLQDSLRSAVDQSLGLSQTQGGDSADGLDDLELLVANGGEDDVELVLLFLSRSSSARSGNGDSSRSGSLDVELLFESLDELGELNQGHLTESFEQLIVGVLSHNGFLSFLATV